MNRRTAGGLALVLLAVLILGAALTFLIHAPDPYAAYRTADGGLHFAPQPKTYTTWAPSQSAYPTLAILGTVRDLPISSVNAFSERRAQPLILPNVDLLAPLRWVVGLFVSNAAASCAGGNCFWIGGTGNFSSGTHWSLTSGGAACSCTPGATNTVTFDSNSGAGTATQDNASFTSGSATLGGSITVAGSSNTWNVGGNWSTTSFSSFDMGTSTIVLAATGTLTAGNSGTAIGDGPKDFYNLTINAGVTTTVARNPTDILISNTFTVNGKYIADIITGNEPLQQTSVAGGATQFPLVLGVAADLTQAGLLALVNLNPAGHVTQYVPSATYMYLAVEGVAGTEFHLTGNVTTVSCGTTTPCSMLTRTYYDSTTQSPTSFNVYTDNFSLTIGGSLWIGDGHLVGSVLWLGSSVVTANGISPNGKGILHAQTSTITVNPSSLYTPVALYLSSDNDGASFLYAETSTITVNGDFKTFNSNDTINLGASTMTISGNWNASASTIMANTIVGTSTVTFTGTGKTVVTQDNLGGISGSEKFYNLIIAPGASLRFNNLIDLAIGNVFTINGTWTTATEHTFLTVSTSGTASPLVLGGGYSISVINTGDDIYFFNHTLTGTTVNIPAISSANLSLVFGPLVAKVFPGIQYKVAGAMTFYSLDMRPHYSGSLGSPTLYPFYFDSQTFNINITDISVSPVSETLAQWQSEGVTDQPYGIRATSGTWTLSTPGPASGMVPGPFSQFYMKLGSTTWNVFGSWTTLTLAGDLNWDAGTSAVNLLGNGGTSLTNAPPFYNLTLGTDSQSSPVYYTMGSNIRTSNILQFRANVGGGMATDLDTSGSSYAINSLTTRASNSWSFLLGHDSLITTTNWDMHWVFNQYQYTCFTTPIGCSSPATVTFVGTGTLSSAGNYLTHGDFWNLTIASAARTTVVNSGLVVSISNVTTVSGTYIGVNAEASGMNFQMWNTATPLVMNPGADMTHSGEIVYFDLGSISPYNVTGGTFQHVVIESNTASGTVVNLAGNLAIDPACTSNTPTVNSIGTDCSFLLTTIPSTGVFTFNTNNYSLTTPGIIFIGDVFDGGSYNQSVIFNAGSSTITGAYIAVIASSVFNMQTATVTANAEAFDHNPVAFLLEDHATVNGGTANVTVNGKLRLWPATDNIGGIYAESSTWNIVATGTCGVYGCPGDVSIDATGYFINFGASSWTVAGNWTNLSTSASWSAGTGSIAFSGISAQTIGGSGTKNLFPAVTVTGSNKAFTADFSTHDFSLTGSTSRTVTITAGKTWTISSSISGVSAILVLRSSSPGTYWNLSPVGATTANTVDVQDSNSSAPVTATGSMDSGHNVNWFFTAGGGGGGSAASDTIVVTQVSGLTYQFSLHTANGTASSATWDFGDGHTGSGLSVYHTYAAPGAYTVTAVVTKSGTQETLTTDLVIASGPTVMGYIFALATAVLLIVAAVVSDERLKVGLVATAIASLVYQLSPYWVFGPLVFGPLVTGLLLLLVGAACLVLAFAPTRKRDRAHGAWAILGVVSLVAYWILVYRPV